MNPQFEERLLFCKNLPTIPSIAMQVIALAGQPDGSMPEVARLISLDPALATKLLKVANSPLYGFRRKTENLRQALSLLGFNAVITLALSFSLASSLRDIKRGGFDTARYWSRSIVAGFAARALGRQQGINRSEELLLAGLLQDIGRLVLDSVLQEEYGRIIAGRVDHDSVIEAERLAFGADHAEVGAWLLRQWNLPQYLQQLVAASHVPRRAELSGEFASMAGCVALSGLMADCLLHPEDAAFAARATRGANEWLGMDEAGYLATLESVVEALPEVSDFFEIELLEPMQAAALRDQANELLVIRHLRAHEEINQVRRAAEELAARSRILEDQVHKDSLTGLFNRSRFDQVLQDEFAHASEQGWPLSVAFIDLDNFKQVNDNFGHQAGDEVLRAIANLMLSHTRLSDILARYGGEEFVAILPGTNSAGAGKLFKRVMAAIRGMDHAVLADRSVRVTLSIGLATHMDQGCCFGAASELLQAADRAMYAAKNTGRDRLVIFSTDR